MLSYSLLESPHDSWTVLRAGRPLFESLALRTALHLAREAARDEHARTGAAICLDMTAANGTTLRLAQYPALPIGTTTAHIDSDIQQRFTR